MCPQVKAKLERRSLGDQVTDIVRAMITAGELKPGQRIVAKRLAAQIGASRTPVREALHRLEQEKLVARREQGGYEVRPLTPREVKEASGIRAALESYAVELATGRIGPRELERLEKNLADFARALERGDGRRLVELNTAFHQTLYRAADSELLLHFIGELATVLHRMRTALLSDPGAARRSLKDHQRMLEAIRKGQARQARRICREHILAGGAWMARRLEQEGGKEPQDAN